MITTTIHRFVITVFKGVTPESAGLFTRGLFITIAQTLGASGVLVPVVLSYFKGDYIDAKSGAVIIGASLWVAIKAYIRQSVPLDRLTTVETSSTETTTIQSGYKPAGYIAPHDIGEKDEN